MAKENTTWHQEIELKVEEHTCCDLWEWNDLLHAGTWEHNKNVGPVNILYGNGDTYEGERNANGLKEGFGKYWFAGAKCRYEGILSYYLFKIVIF